LKKLVVSVQSQLPVSRMKVKKCSVAAVVEDVVSVLTDSNDPKQYFKLMRQRDKELSKGWGQIVPTLWVETAGGIQKR
jgi:hypothetical protein